MSVKNVFILGAGASVDSGAPVMSNFFDTTEDLASGNRIRSESERQSIANVFELIKRAMSGYANSNIDLNNIETVFGLLEMAAIVNKLHEYTKEEIISLRDDLISLIVTTLEHSTKISSVGDTYFRSSFSYENLKEFVVRTGLHNNTIITFNYDIAFEAAFSSTNEQCYLDYGFAYNKSRLHVNESLAYYKLHGSINWFENNENSTLAALDIVGMHRYDNFRLHLNQPQNKNKSNLSIKEIRKLMFEHKDFEYLKNYSEIPFIIPPSWNKSAYHKSVSHIWQKAIDAITEASNIYIIGYSLPESDLFFKYLYTIGTLQSSRIRKLVVYDPNRAVEPNYRNMLGSGILKRFQFVSDDFAGAMRVLNNVQY